LNKGFCILTAQEKISGEMIAVPTVWRHAGFHDFCGDMPETLGCVDSGNL
jgi:hypothetical protein